MCADVVVVVREGREKNFRSLLLPWERCCSSAKAVVVVVVAVVVVFG